MPGGGLVAYHHIAALRFECTQCGHCCIGDTSSGVSLSVDEVGAIRRLLGLSQAWFRRRYVRRLSTTYWEIRLQADGRCPFLSDEDRCSIYALRPAQCHTYPFWPEILKSRKSWRGEARRCEGINRGRTIPVPTIEKKIKQLERL
ncbi:MAG TPA: YkgJ family cysteine cluster protein [Acidiferrobacteraceae bacterium]|nr:YkgJ family cysteine cluster protein [Acidiferrobacteraceae bacterium]